MNKTIKKIMALGIAGAFVGVTLGAAVQAATLADYPSPFVQNGAFVGKIVIGEKAAAVDTLGSMDIAASLQRESGVADDDGDGGAMSEDGYLFQESKNLILGTGLINVTASVDDSELSELLASGTVEDSDGSDYDYDVEIQMEAGSKVSSDISQHELNDKYSTPVVYYDLTTGSPFYTVSIDFQDDWDAAVFTDSETIELFGRAYTFDPDNTNADDILTLFGSDTTIMVGKGEVKTITYNGKEYTLEILGGNSDDSSAILRVGSETKTVLEGDSRTLGGLPIYVKDVFVSNIGGEDVSVQLFVGSNKIEIDEDGTVSLNGVELDEVAFTYTQNGGSSTWDNVNLMEFTITPGEADSEVEYILPGETYTDPLFGAFKFHFVGDEDLMEGRELTEFTRNGKKLDLTFTPRGNGDETTVTLFEGTASAGGVHEDIFVGAALNELVEDDIFIYNEDAGVDDKAITHVIQIDKIEVGNDTTDEDFEVVFKDLTFGKTYTVDSGTKAIDSKIDLFVVEGAAITTIDLSATAGGGDATYNPVFYTNAGAKIEFTNTTGSVIANGAAIDGLNQFKVTEDVDDDDDTSTVDDFLVTVSYDSADDDEYDLGISGTANGATDDDDNYDHYLTDFGTYIVEETDDSGKYVSLYIPEVEMNYDMFLLPIDGTVTVTSSTGGSGVLNPIAVGMAILDSEATLGSKPYIVVGGPCANTVAAELMGNQADCAAGFTEGKAMIKLYSDKNALLVAGYSGKDTQGASRVLANYKSYGFAGTELEVVTTSLTDLKVNKI
ncbi:MAG: hypothetical protein ACP5NV_02970 [Candidatus Woesearchaeota archaeon]